MPNVNSFFIPEEQFFEKYELEEEIGKGAFGRVFQGKSVKCPTDKYAIKAIRLSSMGDGRDQVVKEVKLMIQLEHNCIVRLYNYSTRSSDGGGHFGKFKDIKDII